MIGGPVVQLRQSKGGRNRAVLPQFYRFDRLFAKRQQENSHIEGVGKGLIPSTQVLGTFEVENTYFRNLVDVEMTSIWSSSSSAAGFPNRTVVFRDDVFDTNIPGVSPTVFNMAYSDGGGGVVSLVQRDQLLVYNYNQVAGDNFQVFYNEQAPDFIMPMSRDYLNAAPVAELTNQQLWAQYKIAVAGAPTTATKRNGINGLINPI